jgi:hypothetical protein
MFVIPTTVPALGGILLDRAIRMSTLFGAHASDAGINGTTKQIPSAIAGITFHSQSGEVDS